MTAAAAPAGSARQVRATSEPIQWRKLAWVTWRQHRTAVAGILAALAVAAAVMALVRAPGHDAFPPQSRYRETMFATVLWMLQLAPVLAGIFVGAPLLAREAENGTLKLAWTQGTGRDTWLLSRAIPIAVLLAGAAAGLGAELRWWLAAAGTAGRDSWLPQFFSLNPLPFAGWVTLGLSLGIFLGGLIRRTVPAMAAMLVCYAALLYEITLSWRQRYLPPLHRPLAVQFSSGGGYSYGALWATGRGPGPDVLSTDPGWPDGRLLSNAQIAHHSAGWFRLHHIQLWVTYQPASRYFTFQPLEFGWLVALSLLLIAATVVLIRRRAA
jgi:ABC-2 family transporter protein